VAFITEAISQEIWNAKYRYRYNGQTLDNSIEQTWSRVASAIAGAESLKQRSSREAEFYQLMESFKFLPGMMLPYSIVL
jgi:ribonucleoside-diphosphate reductase alpha chain